MVKIEMLDVIFCRATRDSIAELSPRLRYKQKMWRKGPFAMDSEEVDRYAIDRRSGLFLSGLLPILKKYFLKKKIEFKISGEKTAIEKLPAKEPYLYGIKLREDQLYVCSSVKKHQRGIVLFPTGSGKTVIAAAILSMYPEKKFLFLTESIDLISQTKKSFEEKGITGIQLIGGGHKYNGKWTGRIVISTIQSFRKIKWSDYCTHFDGVIVDEVHNASKPGGIYYDVITKMLAPIRLGLTATMPEDKGRKFTIIGMLGPVIAKLGITQAIEKGILVKPKIKMLAPPVISCDYRNFKDIYKFCVVKNFPRNKAIVKQAQSFAAAGKTTLIMIKEIEHGREIVRVGEKLGIKIPFVSGATGKDSRLEVKELLSKKKIKIVITSEIWNEGIDIPSLDSIINAAGGKSQVAVLQKPGRGMRTSEGKTEVVIFEIIDPYPYVAVHFVKRLSIYVQKGYL